MHTVHNERIKLTATILKNLAAASVVAGFVAPAVNGSFGGGLSIRLDHRRRGITGRGAGHPWRTQAMTWDQAWTYLIWPCGGAALFAAWAYWLSRRA